jgi:ABC-type antimicrobial peptide transport system permease subunit
VNPAFAKRFFDGEEIIGKTIRIPEGFKTKPVPYEVVGVVADTKHESLGEDPTPVIYRSYAQSDVPGFGLNLHVRTAGTPGAMAVPVKEALASLDPTAGIEVKSMQETVGSSLFPNQLGALLLGVLAVLGLALATIGLYGVIAYAVARRTREIGIRIALGASRRSVLTTVLSDAMIRLRPGSSSGWRCPSLR